MKKMIFAAVVVLLAVLVAGCDGFAPPEVAPSNVVGYTDDGRAIVELDLGFSGGGAKALHALVGEAAADYYEVIFNDGTNIYRTNWRDGRVAKLRVPANVNVYYDNLGTHTTPAINGYAYIIAGRYSDKTLLGIGEVKEVLEADGTVITPAKTITADATRVNFEITALETDINPTMSSAGPPAVTFAWGGFQLTGTVPPGTPPSESSITIISVDEKGIPAFYVDDVNPTRATFTIKPAGAALTTVALKIANATAVKGFSSPYVWSEGQATLTKLATRNSITGVAVGTGAAYAAFTNGDPLTFPIGITMTPELEDADGNTLSAADPGLALVYFEIPVYLYNNTNPPAVGTAPETWYFRGGLNNKLLDIGHNAMGLGGAVLVNVGDAFSGFGTGLEIGTEQKN